MLKNYVRVYGKMKMLFASSVSYEAFGFLEVLAIPSNKKEKKLRVSIPFQFVLAIADLPKESEGVEHWGFQ